MASSGARYGYGQAPMMQMPSSGGYYYGKLSDDELAPYMINQQFDNNPAAASAAPMLGALGGAAQKRGPYSDDSMVPPQYVYADDQHLTYKPMQQYRDAGWTFEMGPNGGQEGPYQNMLGDDQPAMTMRPKVENPAYKQYQEHQLALEKAKHPAPAARPQADPEAEHRRKLQEAILGNRDLDPQEAMRLYQQFTSGGAQLQPKATGRDSLPPKAQQYYDGLVAQGMSHETALTQTLAKLTAKQQQ